MRNVILFSGKAGCGKDHTANLVKNELESEGYSVLVTHYADYLKFICKSLFNWDGNKDATGRKLLQYVGTDVVREQNPDFWVNNLLSVLKMFEDNWDYVLIADVRFENEIEIPKKLFNTVSVKIVRTDLSTSLDEEQAKHRSEVALDNYTKHDVTLHNTGCSEYLATVRVFVQKLLRGDYNE